jgi:peptidoglycan/LPS O-acetylase OafA/YrhL
LGEARSAFCLRDPKARFDGGFWAALATFSFNWFRIAREHDSYGFGLHWDILWSLAIEEQFYLAYPWLLRGLATPRRACTMLVFVALAGPLFRAYAAREWPESFLRGFTSSFACFDLIALGALLCFAQRSQGTSSQGGRWRLLALALLGLLGIVSTYRVTALVSPIDRVWGPTAIGLSVCAFLWGAMGLGWLEGRWATLLTYPGQLSYGGYLLHATTLFLLWPLLRGRSVLVCYLLFATSTFVLAALVYRFFEVPVNRKIRALWRAS